VIKLNTPEDKLDEEINNDNDKSNIELDQDKDLENISEDETLKINEETVENNDEEKYSEVKELEIITSESEIAEGHIDDSEGDEDFGGEEIQELPKEASKEDLEKQMREFHKNLIEAALYAAGKPLNVEILSTKLEIPKKEVDELINELAYDYLERSSALIINQIGDSYQMAIKSEYVEKISKFATGGAIAEKYLRTLTIIALKQPILKSTVIKLRGSGAYEHIKYLLDNDLIDAMKKGRSQELTTTDKYAEMFGLPKDKHAMKEMMISQLGLGEISSETESSEQYDEQEENNENDIQE